ncbi:MAG: ribonuclease H-like domain-containing protein [Deltaproteobacteria bacterium]|nr:ribonuclease H-like domain-containing protein [Deltaproteobacteria bacterium]
MSANTALLEDLRRRIQRLEERLPDAPSASGASGPRLPPAPPCTGERAAPLRLENLPGAVREPGGALVVRAEVGPDVRLGGVAPADAFVAHPDVAAPLAGLPVPAPSGLLHGVRFLDIETTGLAGGTGTLAFVVGVARFEPSGQLVVEQMFLGAPAEEPVMLDRLAAALYGGTLLVTFNGRAFDVPLLRTRCVLSRRPPGLLGTLPHLDLLPIARRLWRGRSGDCRLVTLEERVLGWRRLDDLPGWLAPAAYGEFLRTGDAATVAGVVAHNRDDIVGMAALLACALRTYEEPMIWAEDAAEFLAVGEHRLRLGDETGALPLLARALELTRSSEIRRRALTQLARAHRRAGRIDAARQAWERYRSLFPGENQGFVELAKLLEHRARDPVLALEVASQAPHPGCGEVQRRIARLKRRVGGA